MKKLELFYFVLSLSLVFLFIALSGIVVKNYLVPDNCSNTNKLEIKGR